MIVYASNSIINNCIKINVLPLTIYYNFCKMIKVFILSDCIFIEHKYNKHTYNFCRVNNSLLFVYFTLRKYNTICLIKKCATQLKIMSFSEYLSFVQLFLSQEYTTLQYYRNKDYRNKEIYLDQNKYTKLNIFKHEL